MDLIERYLQAVSFWLPTPAKRDILAELSDDIYAQLEERERVVGRSLTDAEISALLKARGRPMLVASAYRPQRYLIGPLLFPIYTFVLRIVIACYLTPALLVWLVLALSPGWRSAQGASSAVGVVASVTVHLWTAAMAALGGVTAVFAVLERTVDMSNLLKTWEPGKLPRLHDTYRLSRGSAILEGAITVVLVGWWLAKMAPLMVINQSGMQVLLAPLWHTFFWGFGLVWLGSAGLAFANAWRPFWTLQRASLRFLLDVTGTVLFCWLAQAEIVRQVMISTYTTERCIALKNSINLWTGRSFPIVLIVGVVIATIDVFRIVRVSRSSKGPYRSAMTAKSGYSSS